MFQYCFQVLCEDIFRIPRADRDGALIIRADIRDEIVDDPIAVAHGFIRCGIRRSDFARAD